MSSTLLVTLSTEYRHCELCDSLTIGYTLCSECSTALDNMTLGQELTPAQQFNQQATN